MTPWKTALVATCLFMISVTAAARVPECDALTGKAATDAAAVLASEHMYDCCDGTIKKCLESNPECRGLAEKVARHVCARAAAGDDRTTITRSLEKRAMTVTGPTVAIPAGEAGATIGDGGAPCTMMIYLCGRCPFCSRLVPEIHREVMTGRLKHDVRVVFKPFPIKSHPHSAEANTALTAAVSLGHGWEFLTQMYRQFDSFSVDSMPSLAVAAGIDKAQFEQKMNLPATRQSLVDSKKEGLKFGVQATPTIFLNGRRYQSELDIGTVVDVVEEVCRPQ